MNEIARNYEDGLTKRSFNNQTQSKMAKYEKPKKKDKKKNNK